MAPTTTLCHITMASARSGHSKVDSAMAPTATLCHSTTARFGKVARWALASFGQVQVLDLTLTDPALKGFGGGFSYGTYHMGTDATSSAQLTSRCVPGVLRYTWPASQFMALMRLAAFNAFRAFSCGPELCVRSMGMCPELIYAVASVLGYALPCDIGAS